MMSQGDALEVAGVRTQLSDGRTMEYRFDSCSVFENRRVRLHELTGDGRDELVVVRSTLERGAAVVVLATGPSGLVLRSESEPIGRPQRWLNLAGIADLVLPDVTRRMVKAIGAAAPTRGAVEVSASPRSPP